MDILTHTISGLAIGTTIASYSNKGLFDKAKIIFASGIAGALPDIDAISLWSGFDSTIGDFFNLTHPGKEIYFSKFWYSHHGFFHSLFASILLASILSGFDYLLFIKKRKSSFRNYVKNNKFLLLAFILGYIIHLIEDMPTPASYWGGVNFFWPLNLYIGGTGDIWWWNNYDIFLIATTVFVLNLTLLLLKSYKQIDIRKITTGIFILGFIFILFQIKTRDFDFSYSKHNNNHQKLELKSKELQKEILGERLFNLMEKFDKKLKFYF